MRRDRFQGSVVGVLVVVGLAVALTISYQPFTFSAAAGSGDDGSSMGEVPALLTNGSDPQSGVYLDKQTWQKVYLDAETVDNATAENRSQAKSPMALTHTMPSCKRDIAPDEASQAYADCKVAYTFTAECFWNEADHWHRRGQPQDEAAFEYGRCSSVLMNRTAGPSQHTEIQFRPAVRATSYVAPESACSSAVYPECSVVGTWSWEWGIEWKANGNFFADDAPSVMNLKTFLSSEDHPPDCFVDTSEEPLNTIRERTSRDFASCVWLNSTKINMTELRSNDPDLPSDKKLCIDDPDVGDCTRAEVDSYQVWGTLVRDDGSGRPQTFNATIECDQDCLPPVQ